MQLMSKLRKIGCFCRLDHPEAYLSSNLVGTFNARRFQPRHLLAASTSSACGGNTKMPFRETDRAVRPLTL